MLFRSVGTVRAREAVTITGKIVGIVTHIRFTEGQKVEAGATLVELDSGAVSAELDQARALLDDARNQLVRARGLQPGQTIAAQRLDTAIGPESIAATLAAILGVTAPSGATGPALHLTK